MFGVYLGAGCRPAGWGGGALRNMVLPVIALALPQIAYHRAPDARQHDRGAAQPTIIRTARAKGLPSVAVILRHALKRRAAAGRLLSRAGHRRLITGSVVIEQIFAIPGIGRYFVQGALNRDYTLVMGVVIFYGVLIIAVQPAGRPRLRVARSRRCSYDDAPLVGPSRWPAPTVAGRSLWARRAPPPAAQPRRRGEPRASSA